MKTLPWLSAVFVVLVIQSSPASAAEPDAATPSAADTQAPPSEPAPSPPAPAEMPPRERPPEPSSLATAPAASPPRAAISAPTLASPAPSATTPYDDAGVPDDGSLGTHQNHFWLTVGARTTFVTDRGFDVFAADDTLAQLNLAFGRVLFADGAWSFASSLAWDIGGRSSDVRGAATKLQVQRFTLNPEARYHILRRLYAFGRVGGGAALLSSTLQDAVGGSERSRDPLRFTLDASVGAALEVLGQRSGLSHVARGWLVVDGGYLFTTSTDLVYGGGSGSPARSAPIALGELALQGATLRMTAAVSF